MEKVNYVDNKELYKAMVSHIKKVQEAEGVPPVASNYIGKAIILICENLGKKSNFSGYSFINDMISDAELDCVKAINNYDTERKNPHAYFSMIAWRAFLRRIQSESKQNYVKHKNYQEFYSDEFEMDSSVPESSNEVIKAFEEKLKKNKSKVLTNHRKSVKRID